MPRCYNHNWIETNSFCLLCEKYYCTNCILEFHGTNYCMQCFAENRVYIERKFREEFPPKPPEQTVFGRIYANKTYIKRIKIKKSYKGILRFIIPVCKTLRIVGWIFVIAPVYIYAIMIGSSKRISFGDILPICFVSFLLGLLLLFISSHCLWKRIIEK